MALAAHASRQQRARAEVLICFFPASCASPDVRNLRPGLNLTLNRDLVFIGGGHTHALVIRSLAMKPIPDVRLTLISEQTLTPYSGMLPGYIAGHFTLDETHIDLNRLCRWANVRWIKARAIHIDPDSRRIQLDQDNRSVSYDKLSIDIGSTPDLSVPGAAQYAVGVKPVSHFNHAWTQLLDTSSFDTETNNDVRSYTLFNQPMC